MEKRKTDTGHFDHFILWYYQILSFSIIEHYTADWKTYKCSRIKRSSLVRNKTRLRLEGKPGNSKTVEWLSAAVSYCRKSQRVKPQITFESRFYRTMKSTWKLWIAFSNVNPSIDKQMVRKWRWSWETSLLANQPEKSLEKADPWDGVRSNDNVLFSRESLGRSGRNIEAIYMRLEHNGEYPEQKTENEEKERVNFRSMNGQMDEWFLRTDFEDCFVPVVD